MLGRDESGYATAVASVICLGIALVVTALVVRSMAELRLAKAEFARMKAENALSAAQNAAMLAIATSSQPAPYHWTVASLGQAVDVLAEPEAAKVGAQTLSAQDPAVLAQLGAANPAAVRDRLAAISPTGALTWVADLDDSPVWRRCAPSYVSQFGYQPQAPRLSYGEPRSGKQPAFFRAGEVWRIQVTDDQGWRDERIVRFTGDGLKPAAILGRRLSRGLKGAQTCEGLLDAGSGG